jgi:uncharacterized protein YegP (UPF0339 family)
MKNLSPVLEYRAVRTKQGKRARWSFRFRTPAGEVLMESAKVFGSKAQAERGFVALIKSVASNGYTVEFIEDVQNGFEPGPVLNGHGHGNRPGRKSRNRLLKYI